MKALARLWSRSVVRPLRRYVLRPLKSHVVRPLNKWLAAWTGAAPHA